MSRAGLAILLVLALALTGCQARSDQGAPAGSPAGPSPGQEPATGPPPAPPPAEERLACPLDGEQAPASAVKRRPLAVMIDNAPQARPQSGLQKACVVYEVLAEGGITRFMALFLHNEADTIGPVRSSRHYFLDLAMEHNAVYAHVGGSPQAKKEIARLKISDLDDMKGAGGFWRVAGRVPPHNLYASTERLRKSSAELGYEIDGFVPNRLFNFGSVPAGSGGSGSRVIIDYPNGYQGYSVEYRYDEPTGNYLRYISGNPHRDGETGEQLRARTVIVQFVPTEAIPNDPDGRLNITFTGSGKALVFSRGLVEEISWSKATRSDPTKFVNRDGKRITLPPGPVWIQVVPPGTRIETP